MKKIALLCTLTLLGSGAYATTKIPQAYSVVDGNAVIDQGAYHDMMKIKSDGDIKPASIRDKAVKDEAMRLGIQYGYAKELGRLQKVVLENTKFLDQTFNFKALMSYANQNAPAINILPPVILRTNDYVTSDGSGQRISISNEYYQLYSNARIVTVAPTWRNYLVKSIPQPSEPSKYLLPRNTIESSEWAKGFAYGWDLGLKQADTELEFRVQTLSRDYLGMQQYLILWKKHKVSSAFVAYNRQNITGNANEMSVNNQVYQISTPAKLNLNTKDWKFGEQKSL
jgi:defect-in-organelle-trafficking protein DotC